MAMITHGLSGRLMLQTHSPRQTGWPSAKILLPMAATAPEAQRYQGPGSSPIAAALQMEGLGSSFWSSRRKQRLSSQALPPTSEKSPLAGPEAADAAPAKSAATGGAPDHQQEAPGLQLDRELQGKLCLLVVAMLWGSYNPILRLLYAQDGPPGPVAIMLFRGVLQAIVLAAAYSLAGRLQQAGDSKAEPGSSSSDGASTAPAAISSAASLASNGDASGSSDMVQILPQFGLRMSFTAIAATELGMWLFLATAIQTLGLQLTTATRAGFLIQATALLTPLLASFTGEKPSRNVWAGCMVALSGCLLIAADASATDADDMAPFSLGGDAAILSAAFFFSLATVRLGTYARRIKAVELAAAKSVVLGGAALGTFLVAAASMIAAGDPISDLWPGYTNSLSWTIMVYSALGPGALAAFLHAKGQSVVAPAEAQVIFSTVPLWSLVFAFILLGGEPMSEKTVLGGAAVVAAGLIASRKDAQQAGPVKGGNINDDEKAA